MYHSSFINQRHAHIQKWHLESKTCTILWNPGCSTAVKGWWVTQIHSAIDLSIAAFFLSPDEYGTDFSNAVWIRELTDFTKINSISQNWLSTGFLCVWALEIKIQICGRPVPFKKKPGWTKKPPKTAFFGKYWPRNDQNGFKTLKIFKEMF